MEKYHDLTEWHAQRVVDEYNTLQESLTIPHSEPRLSIIKRNLSMVAFELHQRIYVDESIQLEEDSEDVSIEQLMANEL